MSSWFCEYALIDGAVEPAVRIDSSEGRITGLTTGVSPGPGMEPLAGLVLSGLANAHSHAFHRALRGRTHDGATDFWAWRREMYRLALKLDPARYYALARAVYTEMALAGITAVGEFHYLHHRPDGSTYSDPNEMGRALIEAATEAGIRLTLLDTCYLASGFGAPPEGAQVRFSDGSAEAWCKRVEVIEAPGVIVGAAIHSVRAVGAEDAAVVADWATSSSRPLHFHLSEQPAENKASVAATGLTPAALLESAGALGPASTAVHGTHLTTDDLSILGRTSTIVCLCPTTERELADGIGPAAALNREGVRLAVGSDGQSVIDLFEETRLVELHERLIGTGRGSIGISEMLQTATSNGMASLGWDSGALEPGKRADFIAVSLNSVRTAGIGDPAAAVMLAATAADVADVVVGGKRVVQGGQHTSVSDPGAELDRAVRVLVDG